MSTAKLSINTGYSKSSLDQPVVPNLASREPNRGSLQPQAELEVGINSIDHENLPLSVQSSVSPHQCSPASPVNEQPVIGLIGMGAMGKMYAKALSAVGWKKLHVCDLPEKYDQLKEEFSGSSSVHVMRDGHAVSRSSDFIVYSVEAEFIERVVQQYGPSTKMHAIVAGQTSVKAPEKVAFEKYLPKDVHIVSCHSLHGPGVNPVGQPLVLIKHRASNDALALVENILRPLKSRFVYLSYEEHDLVTANTQAVTHAAFLSMGTAWYSAQSYPWEHGLYVGGIETAKVNLTLRIYSNAWHVYAGLAILNPSARVQIERYATSATELFKMMLEGGNGGEREKNAFKERVRWAGEVVFGQLGGGRSRRPILLSEDVLDKFSLKSSSSSSPTSGTYGASSSIPLSTSPVTVLSPSTPSPHVAPPRRHRPNSHLSLLAMVDCWAHLGINPYTHLSLAATPLFRLFLGVAEYLFLSTAPSKVPSPSSDEDAFSKTTLSTNESQVRAASTLIMTPLESSIHSALYDTWHRSDDLEFVCAARGWSQAVSFASFELYRKRFDETRAFFEATGRFGEVGKVGAEMIKALMESEVEREEQEREQEST